MKRNITLSLDEDLLARVRILAARRSLSVSRLLATELEAIVREAERYEQSRRRALKLLDTGFHLGGGRPERDALHER